MKIKSMQIELSVVKFVSTAVVLLLMSVFPVLAGEGVGWQTKAVWWWRGADASNPEMAARRFEFLSQRGINEIYFCSDLKRSDDVRKFVKTAGAKGMRVALLAGDVSWIYPGNRGFAETLQRFIGYQKSSAPNERFYALHLDVEPHQDAKLSDARKWQLYADFVLRAAADVHAAGEKIEWDIPFWLDNIRVDCGHRADVPLLEVVMGCSDAVALMSYRDSAAAILDISSTEIAMAKDRKIRVILGAETGETGEGNFVTFFEEGPKVMEAELAVVLKNLAAARIPAGCGVAVHHFGSWEKMFERARVKRGGK